MYKCTVTFGNIPVVETSSCSAYRELYDKMLHDLSSLLYTIIMVRSISNTAWMGIIYNTYIYYILSRVANKLIH